MLEDVKEKLSNLENIAYNFKTMPSSQMTFTKEKITELISSGTKLPLKFNYIIVAMSKNGGLIAFCKKHNYLDQEKTRINDNILVMHQNADTRYYIPLDWDYSKTYIVSLEFNEKEQLFAFCNDGSLFKIDILTNKAVRKVNSQIFIDEGIEKAITFEDGFVALTCEGSIYYVKDIKQPIPIFMINIKKQLGFSNDVDFLGIPSKYSRSKNFELLILNEKGTGVLHVEQQNSSEASNASKSHPTVPVSILTSQKLERFLAQTTEFETLDPDSTNKSDLGQISCMALSPNKQQIALYSSITRAVYCIPSNFKNYYVEKLSFRIDDELSDDEKKEQLTILSYNQKYQFCFCTEDAISICGQRFIIIVNKQNECISFQTLEGSRMDAISGEVLMKVVDEVDGVRYICKEGVFLISKVAKELNDICQPFSDNASKKLINAYGTFLSKNADCDKEIREIASDLPDAIKSLQIAASSIYWVEKDNDVNKELQMILIKASQYGKSFVQKGDFNYDRYVENCNAIRVINCLRNCEKKPRYLTFEEYLNLSDNQSEMIKKILRHLNFELAFDICNFLGLENDRIYQRYIIANIKRSQRADPLLMNTIEKKCAECPNISFITLAKKCIKYNKHELAEHFLEKEKSIVVKVPQYLKLKKWSKALELSLESHDRTVIKVVIDKIYKIEELRNFIKIVGDHPKAHAAVIEYLRTHDKEDDLRKYLGQRKDCEELLFMTLEKFFKSKTIVDRRKYIKEAKEYLGDLKGNAQFNFYKAYLDDIQNSLKFKKECIDPERGFISVNDTSPFDNSIYECYVLGVPKNYDWIEKQNKTFCLGKKKLTYLKFKNWAKLKKLSDINNDVKNVGYKNLEITPLEVAKILCEEKLNEESLKYIKEITDPKDFDEKIGLLKSMKMYEDALEIAISDKKNERVIYAVNDILRIRPDLKNLVSNLCAKYKVSLD